nr:uncharacterized protein LOC112280107 isoform X3 [Physcomitrium patens]|eukprot:XP_024370939.1 uncharacterized protein LOC112280107 isoform X3 [Physcomitrella patens]
MNWRFRIAFGEASTEPQLGLWASHCLRVAALQHCQIEPSLVALFHFLLLAVVRASELETTVLVGESSFSRAHSEERDSSSSSSRSSRSGYDGSVRGGSKLLRAHLESQVRSFVTPYYRKLWSLAFHSNSWMAYIALPTRDSTLLRLANAAPRLPRSASATVQSTCSLKDVSSMRPLKVQPSSLFVSRTFSRYSTRGQTVFASMEGNVTVEEPAVDTTAEEPAADNTSVASDAAEQAEASETPKRFQRSKSSRAAKTLTVQKDQIVAGAVFTGKVRSVQSYGAFVDIGAFTDGLVHISELAPKFVKEVTDVVSIGQEVTVRVLELNEKAGRIALTMRDRENEEEEQSSRPGSESSAGSGSGGEESGRPVNRGKIAGRGSGGSRSNSRASEPKTKLKKGEELKGTVKNIIRNGAFIEFAEQGEEAFLRGSEVTEGGENVPMENLLTVGQEVTVRVLKVERGKAYLTMKPQVDMTSVNQSINSGVVGSAANPFATFFRSVNLVPETFASVDAQEEAPAVEETAGVKETSAVVETPQAEESPTEEAPVEEAPVEEAPAAPEASFVQEALAVEETAAVEEAPVVEETSAVQETPAVEDTPAVEKAPAVDQTSAVQEDSGVEDTPTVEEGSKNVEPAPAVPEASAESSDESPVVSESEAEEPHSLSLAELAEGLGRVVDEVENVVEASAEKIVNVVEAAADIVGTASEAEAAPEELKAVEPEEPKAAASAGPTAAQVKELREKSGAGMMECKKALVACNNDVVKAQEFLRKKGLASAEKKAGRIAAEGRVGSYVHGGRMGVLIEINCETDFVSRGAQFKELVQDMGMQVVACPAVQYVTVDDVPADFVEKEKEIEMGKEDLANKPVQIREKIVEGRIAKRLAELALLEQPYIRDDKVPVKDLVKEITAKLGEKIQIRRFVRYNLGEGLEKKSTDFAAEVAAQTAVKDDPAPAVEAPKVEKEAPKAEQEAPKVAVSASKVKELRQMSGAGMMDCKKALAACDNDLEKASEYLRKKGLASAEKKSGRIASEGLIGSYIHDGRIGVLIEVNSETDFVARSDVFKDLVANMGMQVAACPQVEYVSVDEIPASVVEKEKEIEAGKEDLANKPEAIRSKIVEGRIAKTLGELALLEQPFIRDDKILVKDYIKQTIATLGENIQVRRFTRFNLGEGIEKKSTDFAAEVAAQTGGQV